MYVVQSVVNNGLKMKKLIGNFKLYVMKKEGAIYREEIHEQKQRAKKLKEPKYPFREVKLNPNTTLLVNITKSEKQQDREIRLYQKSLELKRKFYNMIYNFEII